MKGKAMIWAAAQRDLELQQLEARLKEGLEPRTDAMWWLTSYYTATNARTTRARATGLARARTKHSWCA